MYIKCDNINDFCTMITTCSLNNINEVRLFISETDSYSKGLRTASSVKDHIKFTYVFFSPIYTAIYTDNVKNSEYDKIYKSLEYCQEQCNHSFRIQVFNNLSFDFDNNCLCIDNELNII